MTQSENSSATQIGDGEAVPEELLGDAADVSDSMADYYQLQQNLLICTLVFTAVIFCFTWGFYSLNVACNYLIGACTGVVYLRLLAKNVADLGRTKGKLGSGRLALVVGLILIAARWQQLEIVPAFLGFLTYKAAVIAYTLWTAVLPES